MLTLHRRSPAAARVLPASLPVLLAAWALADATIASPIPWTATQTRVSIEVALVGPAPLPSSPVVHSDPVQVFATTATNATAGGAGSDTGPAAQVAGATAAVRAAALRGDATTFGVTTIHPIFVTTSEHSTYTTGLSQAPSFGRAAAGTRVLWTAELALPPIERMSQPTSSSSATLEVHIDFDELSVQTGSLISFAATDQLLTVRQHAAGKDRLDTHYVRLQAANGVRSLVSQVATTGPSQARVADRISTDTDLLGSGAQPTRALTLSVPLLDEMTEAHPNVSVSIDLLHADFSQRTDPRAISVSGPAAGYSSNTSTDIQAPMLRWEPNAKQLSFDPLPITLVTSDGRNAAKSASLTDPLLGGRIEIDPFVLLGMEEEFLVFAGNSFRVRDATGNLLLFGRAPTLVYDTSDRMEGGTDFFSPVLSLVQTNLGDSAWLRDFLTQSSFFASFIPGLHLAAPTLGAVDWQRPFIVAVSGQLGLSGGPSPDPLPSDRPNEAPGPPTLTSMLLALLALLAFRKHR